MKVNMRPKPKGWVDPIDLLTAFLQAFDLDRARKKLKPKLAKLPRSADPKFDKELARLKKLSLNGLPGDADSTERHALEVEGVADVPACAFHPRFLLGSVRGKVLRKLFLRAPELIHDFNHVNWNPNRAGLVGDGARDGLANPPDGVGGELVAAAILEFLDAFHQADVAFLNQIEERMAAVGVFLGDGHDEAQIGLGHVGLGLQPAVGGGLQFLEHLVEFLPGHPHELFEGVDPGAFGAQAPRVVQWICVPPRVPECGAGPF